MPQASKIRVQNTQGEFGYIPAERLFDAITQEGYKPAPKQASNDPTSIFMQSQDIPQTTTGIMGYGAKEFGQGILDVGKGIAQTAQGLTPALRAIADPTQLPEGAKAVADTIKGMNPFTGATQLPDAIKDLWQSGYGKQAIAAQVPRALGQATAAYATGKAVKKTGKMIDQRLNPISKTSAVEQITESVAPKKPPAEYPKFRKDLAQQLDTALDYSKRTSIKPTSQRTFADILKGAGDEKHTTLQGWLDKAGETQVTTTQIPNYGGATQGYNAATINQIYRRLTEINDTMDAAYTKGSTAVGVQSLSSLRTESAALRRVFYSELGKRVGVPSELVAETNVAAGQLGKLSKQVQLASDARMQSLQKLAQGESPIQSLPETAHRALQSVHRHIRAPKADRMVQQALERYKPAVPKQ